MPDRGRAAELLRQNGYDDFRWLCGTQVPVRRWVRFKCRYGCPNYGRLAACPPSVPTLDECRELFGEYGHIAIIRLSAGVKDPAEDAIWLRRTGKELLALERAVFLGGFSRALVLFPGPCRFCETCTGQRRSCRYPADVRPSPEALGVDLFGVAEAVGYDLQILEDTARTMTRLAFLLVG